MLATALPKPGMWVVPARTITNSFTYMDVLLTLAEWLHLSLPKGTIDGQYVAGLLTGRDSQTMGNRQ